jgi:hypothetical protein
MRAILLALAIGAALMGCGPGGECESCSGDSDCKSGLKCAKFDNGDKLCAKPATQTCNKVTTY